MNNILPRETFICDKGRILLFMIGSYIAYKILNPTPLEYDNASDDVNELDIDILNDFISKN